MPFSLQEELERCSEAKRWLQSGAAGSASDVGAFTGIKPPIVMRASAHPAATSWVVPHIFEPSFAVLERMSNSRLRVEGFWGESAHPASQGFEALADGRTDFAPCYTSWEPERFPLCQLLALPGLFPTTEIATAVSEDLYEPYLRSEFERPGVILGRLKATGPYHLFSRRDIRRLSDLRGLKVGTNAGIDSRIAMALGAEPVALRSVDLLPAFMAGRVDAVSLADGSAQVFGVGQRAAVRLEIGIARMNLEFGLSRRFHDQLSDDLRITLNDWLRAQSQAEAQYFYGVGGAIAREAFAAAGCQSHTLDSNDTDELNRVMHALTNEIAGELDQQGFAASSFVGAARRSVKRLRGRTANQLMRDAIDQPRWLLPGNRPT